MSPIGEAVPEAAEWFHDFDDFVIARRARLLAEARAITHDFQLAEDALSETFLKVSGRWDRVVRMDNPESYVRKILVNQCLRLFRKQHFKREHPHEPVELPEQAARLDPHADRDGDERVGAALRQLSPQQRTVLYYRYFRDYSDETIAEIMDLRPGVVRNYASVGQRRLRELLARKAGER